MICPKCGSTLEEGMKFCINCGANIEEVEKELAEKKRIEEEKKKKEEEELKRKQAEEAKKQEELKKQQEEEQKKLEEQRKKEAEELRKKQEAEAKRQEEIKKEEQRIAEEKRKIEEEKKKLEKEKLKALREAEEIKRLKAEQEEKDRLAEENAKKALEATGGLPEEKKEENSIGDAKLSSENESDEVIEKTAEDEFKPAKKQKRTSPKKRRKGFFRRLIDRIILLIVLIAILIGGVYYLNIKGYLPEVVSTEINNLIDQIKDVKDLMDKNYENEDEENDNTSNSKDDDSKSNENITWVVENKIEADDIINLNEEVSAIVVDGKYGIVDNESGNILLDTEHDSVFMSEGNIIVSDDSKYYNVDSMYQVGKEVTTLSLESDAKVYYYNTSNDTLYLVVADLLKKIDSASDADEYVPVIKVEFEEEDATLTKIDGEEYLEGADYTEFSEYAIYDMKNKKLVTEFDYSKIYDFVDDYAAIMKDKKAGFIKTDGSEVMLEFEETRNVYNGVAWAKLDGKWGLVEVK